MDKKSNVKKRNWAFVLYPDSAPENWLEIIQKSGLQGAISPLHDKDLNDTGEEKKAHFHIILIFSGPTSFNVVNNFTSSLNQRIPQPLESVRGYYRYLTHKDNPDKYQYNERDISVFNGFDISDFVELSKSEVLQIKKKIQQFIRDNKIYEYCDLMDVLLDNDMIQEYDVASSNTYFFEKYISSRRNQKKLTGDPLGISSGSTALTDAR